jgi:hypothetical protein
VLTNYEFDLILDQQQWVKNDFVFVDETHAKGKNMQGEQVV